MLASDEENIAENVAQNIETNYIENLFSVIRIFQIMILLIEGILPQGYFSGSLSGLQADMAVFRELLATKLPKLSKHLQKLQGPSAFGMYRYTVQNQQK